METNATLIECCRSDTGQHVFSFLIMGAPSPSSLPNYVAFLQRHHVKHLVRACGPTYNSQLVEESGIQVHSLGFDDGAPPTQAVVNKWLDLLSQEAGQSPPPTIAVHCVAGLGRASILVALAQVEFGNMVPLDAIGYIRERRKGAINQVQLHWLMRYKPRYQRSESSLACTSCSVV
ncbi:unnamed protein product [Phytomonas sp. Hart1]|nr:unnamed protein product [Phytomonas sp. Hart1]|eukprot:CCW71723.1 unnamed protein product [Phytomonas sp. isolate Hart1]